MSTGNQILGGTTITGMTGKMGAIIRGGGSRTGLDILGDVLPSFSVPLQTSLVPTAANGSATPTFTRATTAYVLGYSATAVLGVDSPVYLLCDAAEARFMGARRISANNWSATDANGVALTTTNGAASTCCDAGGPYGYLAEGARADVLGTTAAIRRTMTDVGWVNTNMTVGAATGVDGVGSAGASLTATAGNATTLFTTVLGAAVRTYSVWARRKTGTGTVNMTKDGGATWTPITLTTTYTQFQVTTASAANPVVGFQIVTNADAIEVDFNTLEQATFANPTPIPVNVSKAADVLRYVASGNMNAAVGTSYAEVYSPTNDYSATSLILAYQDISSAGSLRILASHAPTTISAADGANAVEATGLSSVATGVRKRASAWSGTTMLVTGDGATPASGTFNGNMGSSYIQVGGGGFGQFWFGTIRNVKLYPTALSAAKLTSMTT